MVLGALIGVASVITGLWVSWHASTAAGATIALVAALSYFVSALARSLVRGATVMPAPAAGNPEPTYTAVPQPEMEPISSAPHHP
jgi:zinc/manganese transport system permease protein